MNMDVNVLNAPNKKYLKKGLTAFILFFISMFVFPPLCFIFMGYAIYVMVQYLKYIQNLIQSTDIIYNEVSLNPSDEAVDKLKDFIEQNGCIDKPEQWNKLRAVWVAINNSPNVSTEKKKEIIQFLRLKGLTMYYKEAQKPHHSYLNNLLTCSTLPVDEQLPATFCIQQSW